MDLPDCPPGAEGYEDTVTEVPKKDPTCTKAEQEFQEHLNSLKIKLEDGTTRPMVERSGGRDVSGKWIYLCYPCAAVCSGESVLQTHTSGKKHKAKLSAMNVWPLSIFTEHPYHQHGSSAEQAKSVKQPPPNQPPSKQPPPKQPLPKQPPPKQPPPKQLPTKQPPPKVCEKPKNVAEQSNKFKTEVEKLMEKQKEVRCHLQDTLDTVKAPLIGLEYLIEHPPEEDYHEPKYICTLCIKQGHPRTIVNHITSFWHRHNYVVRHFPKAGQVLATYRQHQYRDGVTIVTSRLIQRIEDKFGRLKPINIDKEIYDRNRDSIHQWICNSHHFQETEDCTFKEIMDIGLIESLAGNNGNQESGRNRREPSPPVVAAPSKPRFNNYSRPLGRQERRTGSAESLSDISDDQDSVTRHEAPRNAPRYRQLVDDKPKEIQSFQSRYTIRNSHPTRKSPEKTKARNYDYKVKLATDKRIAAEDYAKKTLAYHEKNPEKHPLYPEEWKKFWNKRYKELQAEGKDPSKHDFKPEWIVFWTARMKELHDQELRVTVNEIYRKMCLTPPDLTKKSPEPSSRSTELHRSNDTLKRSSPENRRRSPDVRRRSPDQRRRSPDPRRRSPDPRRRSPEPRRRSPLPRRRSPDLHRRSPALHRRSPDLIKRSRSPIRRLRSPPRRDFPDTRRDRRSPDLHLSAGHHRSMDRHLSPHRMRSRSPLRRASPQRTRIQLDSVKRSRSPLSQREMQPRNRSPELKNEVTPSMQTVLVSDDDLKPDDGGLSPWNSDVEIASVESLDRRSRSRCESHVSRSSRSVTHGRAPPPDNAAPDDVIATLRLLVALEDYLGSLGPKLIDLLAEALRMEKEKANSSEELLVRESAMVLVEMAKEKLKGAIQAGLVTGSAATAARAAVVRAAATLHEADKRTKALQPKKMSSSSASKESVVPVAGVGEVDRAQIAQQMAEALIAQGKTDVSSEELAQLVDAVVGMAEAKKREAERLQPDIRPATQQAQPLNVPPRARGTASALQMLQSAYDENDKRAEKEEAADAMDGLSDSDLETLLKNFNELSAEEQHSLIAYLKKLEAREPVRVERLRQYVSDAAHVSGPAPAPAPQAPPNHLPNIDHTPVVLESDDDDYTVEEVIQSATQKVQEDKIRQEMEIVKKSLKEITTSESSHPIQTPTLIPTNIIQSFSSASDLFALVQASVKAAPGASPASISQSIEVVSSSTQPRSFGDLPPSSATPDDRPKPLSAVPILNLLSSVSKSPLLNTPQQNFTGDRSKQSEAGNQGSPPTSGFNKGNELFHDRHIQSNPSSDQQFNQRETTSDYTNQINQSPTDCYTQSNEASGENIDQEHNDRFNQGAQALNARFNQINQPSNDRNNQGKQVLNDRFSSSNQPPNDRFNQSNQPPQERFNQGNQLPNNRFNQGGQPPNDHFNQAPSDQINQSQQQPMDNFNQGNRLNQFNQTPHDQFHQSQQLPNDGFTPGFQPPNANQNYQPNDNFKPGNQWNQRPNLQENRGPPVRGHNNLGPYSQGPRSNFMNNRGQDNFDNRQNNQQFGNYDNQNKFRGRGGRGYGGGGPMRGRGRGRY